MASKPTTTVVVLTEDALQGLVKQIEDGFNRVEKRIASLDKRLQTLPEIKKIGSQTEEARRIATAALRSVTTRPPAKKKAARR